MCQEWGDNPKLRSILWEVTGFLKHGTTIGKILCILFLALVIHDGAESRWNLAVIFIVIISLELRHHLL